MAQVVVDTSVALKWFVPEAHAMEARRVLQQYEAGQFTILVPDLMYAEFGNIVWKKHCFEGLALDDARIYFKRFIAWPFDVTPAADLVDDAFAIAVAHRRAVYDAIFLALSTRHRCRFVTADERLFNAVKAHFPDMIWIADWP